MFGIILQDTWLYNGSIMENIRYGRLDATDEELLLQTAMLTVCPHAPNGYAMELNEEASNVSQDKAINNNSKSHIVRSENTYSRRGDKFDCARTEVQIKKL